MIVHNIISGERLDNFLVGVTNDFSPPNWVVRGSYPLCGQYSTATYSKMYLNCTANTPPGQFVIIQQPSNRTGWLTICEFEVYGYGKYCELGLSWFRPCHSGKAYIS